MGAREHLVAISNWDPEQEQTKSLPRVGDYREVDWEKLAQIRPTILIVQFAPEKMPAGLNDRAKELGIAIVNVRINTIDDVFHTIEQLGDAAGERAGADEAAKRLRARLDDVKKRAAASPVRTLLVRDPDCLAAVGGGNFLDELLTIAGGKNVLATGNNSYPTIDREQLAALDPEVIIQLLPGASAQVIQQSKDAQKNLPQVKAIKNGRVYLLSEPYLLMPGYHIADIAERFAEKLHPNRSSP
jgi:iron complex transport system substrate-binding protein